MQINEIPKMNMDKSETGCCPRFDPTPWDKQTFIFENKLFAKAETCSFFHIPLNMGKVFTRVWTKIWQTNATPDGFLVLSYGPSMWKEEHYFAVNEEIPGEEMVKLSGTFLSKVFEGPFQNAGKWMNEMTEYVKSQGKTAKKMYMFYTTCPRCAKHYGKNFVVIFAQV